MYFPFIINVSHCWKYLEYLLDTLSVWLMFVYIADTQVFAIIVNITFPFLYSFSTMLLIPHLFKWHGQNLKYFTRNSYIKSRFRILNELFNIVVEQVLLNHNIQYRMQMFAKIIATRIMFRIEIKWQFEPHTCHNLLLENMRHAVIINIEFLFILRCCLAFFYYLVTCITNSCLELVRSVW